MTDDRWEESPVSNPRPFELLSDGTRRDVVAELAAVISERRESIYPRGSTFSELRERSDVDDPGRFRYHLNELLGALLTRDDDEYHPRRGTIRRVIGLAACDREDVTPFRNGVLTQFECPHCDRWTTADYDDSEVFFFYCPEHHLVFHQHLPPSLDSESAAAWIDYAIRRMHHDVELTDLGLCPRCQSTVDSTLRRGGLTYDSGPDGAEHETSLWAHHTCRECDYDGRIPAGTQATVDARVRSLFTRHDVDVRTLPFPDKHVETTAVFEEDGEGHPVDARVRYSLDGVVLDVRLGAEATVTRITERSDA